MIYCLVSGLSAGTHHDDHALGIGRAYIVEQVILTSDDMEKLVHDCLHLFRAGVVVRVTCFTRLKIDVGILCGAAQDGMVGRKRSMPVFDDAIHIDEGAHVVFSKHLDFVDLMRGAEAIKEM